LLLGLATCLFAAGARARPAIVAVEIGPRAEAALDARAVRRLVQLELADVNVPPEAGATDVRLFVRVLATSEAGQLRIELWELGEQHGARAVATGPAPGARGGSSLVARRVALAAAELARGLRQRRRVAAVAAERVRRRADARARLLAGRTLDGPVALRVGAHGTFAERLVLAGPVLDGELHVYRGLRLDVGAGWSFGAFDGDRPVEAWSLRLGPMKRFVLGGALDLDLGGRADASVLAFSRVNGADGQRGQYESWWARLEAVARLQPRLARSVRLSFGVTGGTTLRRPHLELTDGSRLAAGRAFFGAELGVVLTPANGR
jgi:hypothetical protein